MITDLKINEEKKKEYYEKGYWTHDTIRDVWERQAQANADKEYVADDQGCRMTYGEVDDAASRLAAWLVSQGIKPGDVVTLQFPNWAEFTIAYVACFKAGAVIQSLARNFNGADLTYAMNLVESRAYIGPTSFHGVDYEQQILDIAGDIPTLKVIALVDKKAPKQTDLPTVAEIVATTEPLAEKVPVESDQVACLLSTSGTTGKPKEVMLTHNNILFSERVFVEGLERTADDVMWMPAPLNHAVGFFHGLVAPMLLGGRSVLMQDFAVKDAIDLINAEGATWSMCSTPFIYDIVKYLDAHPDESLPTYVLHSCGGAPVPGALIDRAHNHDILLCEIFGSTESCPHVFVPPSKCVEWNGDWYGWWIIESGTGDYALSEGGWWDACAHIDLGEDGSGTLTLWDDSCEAGEYIAQASVQAEADLTTSGRLVSTDGSFLNCPLTGADAWYIDAAAPESMPYHDMICISGVYTDPEGSGSSFVYTIYLRPWGMDWEDVRAADESLLPYYYDDWYLPLIEAGGSMPDQIGEALSYA